jgi:hypothetical protein
MVGRAREATKVAVPAIRRGANSGLAPPPAASNAPGWSLIAADEIGNERLHDFDLTHFLRANRYSLRWKTL